MFGRLGLIAIIGILALVLLVLALVCADKNEYRPVGTLR